jgi:HEPN domain-containing protein
MPVDDPVHELTLAWLRHAETDILAATVLLSDVDDLAPSIAFHAQQAIEKALKAVLVASQVDFRRTHQLTLLADLIPAEWDLRLPTEQLPRISHYAAETRYPIDDWNQVEPVTVDEARSALEVAQSVHTQVAERLRAQGIIPPDAP